MTWDVPFTFRPIDHWPGGALTQQRRRSNFSAGWGTTLRQLDHELGELGAAHVVLQIAMKESDIRLDGRPRARATAEHPGVVLAFDSMYGPLKYAVDTFDRWEDNVRAIALALEALRKVDRYGVTRRGEQYTGWRQIEQHTGGFQSAEGARDWMHDQLDQRGLRSSDDDDAYKQLARRLHPDADGGSHEEFVKLQQARELIEA